jgi:hypothetical protein
MSGGFCKLKEQPNKRVYEVHETETIDQCLDRIKADGFMPVKRIEKPVFKEEQVDGSKNVVPAGRMITFEARKI